MDIITDYDKLSERCDEVIDLRKESQLVQKIILDLKKAIRENNLVGLAANQLGYDKRIFVIAFGKDLRTFINPIISQAEGLDISIETCPSLPDKRYLRLRNSKVSVTYMDPLGKVLTAKGLVGRAAFVAQELIDHLEGVLLSDIGLELDSDFDAATDDERAELIKAYCDAMDLKLTDLNKAVEDDPELKKISDATKLLNKIQTGEVTVEVVESKVKKK